MKKLYTSYCDRETEENNYHYDCRRLDCEWNDGDDPCWDCCHRREKPLKVIRKDE